MQQVLSWLGVVRSRELYKQVLQQAVGWSGVEGQTHQTLRLLQASDKDYLGHRRGEHVIMSCTVITGVAAHQNARLAS